MLPVDIILIRHGKSEGNKANKASRGGDNRLFTLEFRNRHSRTFRLTDTGIEQAKAAGEWLRSNVPMPLDRFYVSDYMRVKETAGYLDLSQAEWRVDFQLRERDMALMDNCPESEKEGLAVCHGHVMRGLQMIFEDLGHDDFIRLDSSEVPADMMLNCQILWYTRRDPDSGKVESSKLVAVRSVCNYGLKGDYGWRRIERKRYSNQELLDEVNKYPRHIYK